MIRHPVKSAVFALLLAALAAGPAFAQNAARQARPAKVPPALFQPGRPAPAQAEQARVPTDDENARETRQRFLNTLRQYPPSLGEVLRMDPSLMTSETYLATYPGLAAFLAQHPEIAHNPGYFVGEFRANAWDSDPRRPVIQLMENVLGGLALLLGFVTAASLVGWLLKSLIDHRRWLRLSKVQTEAHWKLLDRLTSNEDLLAYIQSSAGRRFLESAPISVDAGTRPISAPVGRILWSVQAGLVVAFGGLGLLYVSSRLAAGSPGVSDLALPFSVMGIVALALGVGFVVSAVVAYGISQRLGLFDAPAVTPHA